jgi:hypothetical protein
VKLSRLRQALHDAVILYLAPWLPSWLPWPWAYACYRFFARFRYMYDEPADAGGRIAPQYLSIGSVKAFKRDVRTIWLLDAVDLYLSRRHRSDWMPSHVDVEGEWPAGAFVTVGFHYSTGLWVFRDLRRNGHDSVLVAARFDPADYRNHPVRYRYTATRFAEVERLSRQPIAYRPGIRERLLAALAAGMSVVSVMDMPPRLVPRGQQPVRWLDRNASLPDGSLAVAREAGVPVVPFWVEVDLASGRRKLVIGKAMAPDPAQVLPALAASLDRLIRIQPAAWLFWNEWPAWQRDAAALHETASFSNESAEGKLTGSTSTEGAKR